MNDLEKIYDEQIYPLMEKIINICKENRMPFACQFAIDDADAVCTSYMAFGNEHMKHIAEEMHGERPVVVAMTITSEKG